MWFAGGNDPQKSAAINPVRAELERIDWSAGYDVPVRSESISSLMSFGSPE